MRGILLVGFFGFGRIATTISGSPGNWVTVLKYSYQFASRDGTSLVAGGLKGYSHGFGTYAFQLQASRLLVFSMSFRFLCEPSLHEIDLSILSLDNFFRELLYFRVLAVLQNDLCHINGTHMVRQHALDEVDICVA